MTRLQRMIQCFNDYDNLIKDITSIEGQKKLLIHDEYGQDKLKDIRNRTSLLIGELRRDSDRKGRSVMLEFYDDTYIHSARKPHICEYCKDTINPGESYYQEKGKFDGEFFCRSLHPVCHGMEVEFCSEIDNEFCWDEITDYVKDSVCWNCIHSIKNEDADGWTECPYKILQDCPQIIEKFMPKR